MSKMVIYVLDKFVWMMVVTVITTQALQMAGVVDTPKGLGEIELSQKNEYEFKLGADNSDVRGKRETEEGAALIDNIFNIPISTLNAVNQLVKNAAPVIQRVRENANRRIETANQQPHIVIRKSRRQRGKKLRGSKVSTDNDDLLDGVDLE